MPPKPLINENLLQKITKITPFHIRSKQNPHKPTFGSKSLKNIELPSLINKQLETCIELVNQQVEKTFGNNRDFLQRIAKLLLDVKNKWKPIDQQSNQTQPEQHEITPQILRKSSSKYFSKNKFQLNEQPKFSQGNFFTDKSTGQLKKNKLNKLKLGKQNNQRFMPTNQIKIDKLTSKLQQAEKIVNEYKQQIQRLKLQILHYMETNQQLQKQKMFAGQEIIASKDKIKSIIDEKMRLESDFQVKVQNLLKKVEQSSNQCKILRCRLQQRQKQIAALWQLQKN